MPRMPSPRPFFSWSPLESTESLLLVAAALEVGLLDLLERERTAEELAREGALDPRAVAIFLRALEELGVVERGPGGFRLSSFGRSRFVDRDSPRCVAADLRVWRSHLRGWLFLEEALRTGRSLPTDSSPAFRESLYRSLDAKPPDRVARLVELTLARSPGKFPSVLDVGGGAGTYARGFIERGCRVTLVDRPETIEHVREAFGLARLRDLTLVAGDYATDLPQGPFGVVLLAEVLHDLSAPQAQALLRRAARAGTAEGVIAVADLFRGRSPRAALFAVTLLLYTEGGDTYAEEEVRGWLEAAGFEDPHVDAIDADLGLITARFPAGATRRSD